MFDRQLTEKKIKEYEIIKEVCWLIYNREIRLKNLRISTPYKKENIGVREIAWR